MHYPLVDPERLTEAHRIFIAQFVRTIALVSSCSGTIVGAKDVRSRYLAASDAFGRIVGLGSGAEVAGRLDCDLPCEDVAQFAECYVCSDRRLLDRTHVGATQTVLNIHRYATGLKALVFDKSLLKHHPTRSILGIVYKRVRNEHQAVHGAISHLLDAFRLRLQYRTRRPSGDRRLRKTLAARARSRVSACAGSRYRSNRSLPAAPASGPGCRCGRRAVRSRR